MSLNMKNQVSNLMTKEEIIDYVFEKFNYFKNKENIQCEEIGDGNINYVFRVFDNSTKESIVIKQADVLLRSSGRPLDLYRSKIESEVLKLENKLFPGSVPEVYHYDEEKALLVMEDISSYHNLRKELLRGKVYDHLPESLSDFLAKTLIPTTDLVIDRHTKKQRVKKFTNPELCDITEDLVLTEPYYNYKNRNIVTEGLEFFVEENLYNNNKLHVEVLRLKDRFQNYTQALIHGDLHSGSIFVNDEGIKVIDPEFAFYGPIGYDIGNIFGNLIFPLVHHMVLESNDSLINSLKEILEDTINETIKKLGLVYDKDVIFPFSKNEDYKSYYINEILADSFGYSGTELIRRTVGDSKVLEVTSVNNLEKRQVLDKTLINIGISLILEREAYKEGRKIINLIEEKVGKK